MARTKTTPRRSERPMRNAAATSRAINRLLVTSNSPVDFSLTRKAAGKRIRHIKIKKLLPQAKQVQVKKNGQVIRRMTVRRKSYYPGRRKKTY